MGLFSSKKKTTVATTVTRAIEDANLPDSVRSSVIKAIMDGNPSYMMSDYIIDGLSSSVALKVDRMYSYGNRAYYYGNPVSSMVSDLQGQDVVRQVLEQELGLKIDFDYYHYAPPNSIHLAWQRLVERYGYDVASNEIQVVSAQQGAKVYLKDLVAVYTRDTFTHAEAGAFDQWGVSPKAGWTPARKTGLDVYAGATPYEVDDLAAEDYVRVSYAFEVTVLKDVEGGQIATTELREGSFNLLLDGFVDDGDYYQVRWTSGSRVGYWTYEQGSGLYPDVDDIYLINYEGIGDFYPRMYFRLGKNSLGDADDLSTEAYKTSVKLASYLGMDYDEVVEAINANPDIDDVEQALMFMAVPANTTNELECRYLFDYFTTLYYNSGQQPSGSTSLLAALADFDSRAGQAVTITDKAFTMTLAFQGIGKKRVNGSIGKVGTHSSGTGEVVTTERYRNGRDGIEDRDVSTFYHYYRKQVSPSYYEEVRVYGLSLRQHIYGKYSTTGEGASENLLIPLDRSVTKLITLGDREILYSRAMHYVFNSRIVTKTKWYQSGWFKVVLIIVSIVIIIFTAGSAAPAIAAAWAAGITTFTYLILTMIVKALVVRVIATAIAKRVGGEAALIIATVAAVVGIGTGMMFNTANGALWAQNLMTASSALASAGNAQITTQYNNLLGQYQDFSSYAEEQTKELETATHLLDQNNLLDVYSFINLDIFHKWSEPPDDFYQRTVHSGNIGTVAFAATENFYELALTLPKLDDTLGGMVYG